MYMFGCQALQWKMCLGAGGLQPRSCLLLCHWSIQGWVFYWGWQWLSRASTDFHITFHLRTFSSRCQGLNLGSLTCQTCTLPLMYEHVKMTSVWSDHWPISAYVVSADWQWPSTFSGHSLSDHLRTFKFSHQISDPLGQYCSLSLAAISQLWSFASLST